MTSTSRQGERLVATHCCFCALQCGMYLRVADNEVVGVEAWDDFPVNQGRLCPKGVVAYQQVRHPQRLLHPLVRKNGRLKRASWDEALDLVAGRLREIQGRYGKDAVAVYSGASITNEKAYLMGKFARVALGTRHIDPNGRLCMVSAGAANMKAFGIDRMANPLSDIPLAEVIFLAGSNTAECHPILMQYLWQARDRGAHLIVVDPRVTQTARTADIHLQIRPGTDLALANGILRVLIHEEMLDREFIASRTNGFEEAAAVAEGYPPERVAEICDIAGGDLVEAAHLWGRAKTSFLGHARGVEHQTKGPENVMAYINLVLATGRIGRPGCGYGTLTGQGNGQGGREHGQRMDQLPGARSIADPEARRYIASVWGIAEEDLPEQGVACTEYPELIERGELRGMLSYCNNPMVSFPNVNRAEASWRKLEFLAVIEYLGSETTELADVVLPGSCWAEDEGTTTNIEGRVVKHNKAVDPPGEARVDWEIICELARRLGKGSHFPYKSARDIWEELRVASKGGSADYYGISWERIEQEKGVFWPCPTAEHPGTPRLFQERFHHTDGRARFHGSEYQPPAEEPDEEYPLYCTTGRVVSHYLSGNQTRRIAPLVTTCPEPYLEIHPQTARRYGTRTADMVRVKSRRGEVVVPARLTATIRPDTVFLPYHWGHDQAANRITSDSLAPLGKIPEYKVCAVQLERV